MPIKVGDDVKTGGDSPKYGRVVEVSGSNATFRTAWNERITVKSSELTETSGMAAKMKAFGPDMIEIAANAAVFAGTQVVRKKGAFGEASMRFVAEDLVYEFFLKKWARENIDEKLFKDYLTPLVGEAAEKMFTSVDAKDALCKTISIAVLDGVYKLVRKGSPLNKSTLMYLVQVIASFYGANLLQRQFRKEGTYKMT